MLHRIIYTLALLIALSPFALHAQPTANSHVVSALPYAPCIGSPVLFTAVDTTGNWNQAFYYWNFGDGGSASSNLPSTSHVYSAPGLYTVMFYAYDSIQGFDSSMVTITVDSMCPGQDLVSGIVYEDVNGNGAQDPGENGINGALLQINPGPYYFTTNPNGSYGLNLPAGSYTIDLQPTLYHNFINPATGSLSVTSAGTGSVMTGYDFGIQGQSNVLDVRVTAWGGPPVPGFQRMYYLNYYNVGTSIASGTITFTYDAGLTYVSSTAGTNAGNTVTWNYSGLLPGGSGYLSVVLQTPVSAVLGTPVTHYATINPIPGDVAPNNNIDTLNQIVVGSYDPNDKQVLPAGQGATGDVAPGTELTYTVRFQNTGTFYATNVVVRDTLDADLDRLTLEVHGSSHPMTWHLNQDEVVFEFMNIMLPDSNTNEPASHGWLRYSITPKAGSALGTTIENSAAIYFDFNAPIITNTTLNTLANLVSVAPGRSQVGLTVAPNPFNSQATVRFDNSGSQTHSFTLVDLSGKAVRRIDAIAGETFTLDRAGLPAGMYLYRLDNAEGKSVAQGRIVIQ